MKIAASLALALVAVAAGASLSRPAPPPPASGAPPRITRERIWFASGQPTLVQLPGGNSRPVASMLNTDRAMHYGEFRWNDAGIPAGQLWVRIDLKRQLISVFRGGHEIGTAVILYGTDGMPTPTGSFPILGKAAAYRSHTYDADMPFMLRLTDDGVAIHASAVRRGRATHGCIGVPMAFAQKLFGQAKRGDIVSILPAAGTA